MSDKVYEQAIGFLRITDGDNILDKTRIHPESYDLVYKMLDIPQDLYTPLFAVARVAGWSAHRIEELTTGNRIIRPAYKSVAAPRNYVELSQRSAAPVVENDYVPVSERIKK